MKRGIVAGIVAVVLLISGCQSNIPTTPIGFDDPIRFPAEKNAQNEYLLADATSFQEAEGFFCGTNLIGNYLQYYDKASGISGVLCADPSCSHDSVECGAYIKSGATLSYYDGKLYWIANESTNSGDVYLWKSDLSGTNREKIKCISFEKVIYPYQPQRYVIHHGMLYMLGISSVVDGTQTGHRVSLLSQDLSSNESFTVLYDEVFPYGASATARFVGESVYLSVVAFQGGGPIDLSVIKFDTERETSEVVYQETGITENPGAIWVTEDHEIYLPGSTDKEAYIWKLENNRRIEITSWSADKFSTPHVMDQIAAFFSLEENTRMVDICDFSGATIYSGKLFPDSISGLDKDPNTYSFAVLGGDTEKLIINLTEFNGTELVDYTILLDLKNNLKATILWSSEK